MATFQERIEDHVGTLASADTAFMTDVLTDGARVVVDHLANKGSDKLEIYATDKTDPDGSTGIAITGGRALSAHKAGYEAKPIPRGMVAKASDGDSLEYAITTDPSWYIDSTKGYVLPGGGVIKWFGYPTVAFGDSTITNYPTEALGAVVYYAAIQGQIRIISDLISTTMAGVTFAIVTTLPTGATPNFSYTKPTLGGAHTDMTDSLTDQDIELGLAYAKELDVYLGEYSTDIQNELNEFNAEIQNFMAARESDKIILQGYQNEVNKEVGRIQSVIQQYASMYQGYFQNMKELKEEYNRLVEVL